MLSYKKDFFSALAQTSPEPLLLEITGASGITLTDNNGKKYSDLISGIAVSNLGHGNKAITNAIKKQADKFTHLMVYGEYIQAPQALFAKRITALLPRSLNSVYFVNSGSEAVEGALKLAKRFTGRTQILSFKNAYHGSTHGALSVMGDETLKSPYRPLLPGITLSEINDETALKDINADTACVIIEPIQGEGGTRTASPAFLSALRKKCSAAGALLIFDEIQTGFGRTGRLFAFEHAGVTPDILLLGKALGGGMPLGAFIASRKVMACLAANPPLGHITTFGGHPVSCAAGLTALNELLKKKLTRKAKAKEKLFRRLLKHKSIVEIRGKGLMLAIQFENEQFCKKVIAACLQNGIIVDWFLFCPSALRLAPPLIINEKEIRQVCRKIIRAMDEVSQA